MHRCLAGCATNGCLSRAALADVGLGISTPRRRPRAATKLFSRFDGCGEVQERDAKRPRDSSHRIPAWRYLHQLDTGERTGCDAGLVGEGFSRDALPLAQLAQSSAERRIGPRRTCHLRNIARYICLGLWI